MNAVSGGGVAVYAVSGGDARDKVILVWGGRGRRRRRRRSHSLEREQK